MWFEILPSAGIIFGCIVAPQFCAYAINKLAFHGKPYRRPLHDRYDQRMFLRDVRIVGDAYLAQGLECIPDN